MYDEVESYYANRSRRVEPPHFVRYSHRTPINNTRDVCIDGCFVRFLYTYAPTDALDRWGVYSAAETALYAARPRDKSVGTLYKLITAERTISNSKASPRNMQIHGTNRVGALHTIVPKTVRGDVPDENLRNCIRIDSNSSTFEAVSCCVRLMTANDFAYTYPLAQRFTTFGFVETRSRVICVDLYDVVFLRPNKNTRRRGVSDYHQRS